MARRTPPGPRSSAPQGVADLLPRLLEDLGLDAASRHGRILRAWDEALGAGLAAHCRPDGVRNGEALGLVPDSSWMQRIQLEKPHILARFREQLGEDAPTGLRLRIGRGGPG